MEIGPAGVDDLEAVTALVAAAIRGMESKGIFQWDGIYPDRARFLADIAEGALFVCRDGDETIGVAALNEYQDPEYVQVPWRYRGEPIAVVHRLCVDPRRQGQGVATALMDFVERRARHDGYAAIRLDAFTHNPAAVMLYERRGYRRAGTVLFRMGPFHCFEKRLGQK